MAELKQSPLAEAAKEMGAVEVDPVPTYEPLSEVNLFLSVPKGHMKRYCEPGLEVETFVLMKTEAEQAGLVLEGAAYAPTPYNTSAAPPKEEEIKGPLCDHGQAMTWKTGTSKRTGEPWKAWMCTHPDRSQQCKPVFINDK